MLLDEMKMYNAMCEVYGVLGELLLSKGDSNIDLWGTEERLRLQI